MSRMLRLTEIPVSKATRSKKLSNVNTVLASTKPNKSVIKKKGCKPISISDNMSLSEYKKALAKLTPEPYESAIQISVIEWAETEFYKGNPLSLYIHHSPNGGTRDKREAARFKAMGTQSGYPDLTLDIAKGGYHGMRIELKRSDNDKESDNQVTRIRLLREEGYHAVITKGYDATVKAISDYMKL